MVDTNFKKIFLKKNFYDKQNMYTEDGNPLQCSCLENPRDGGAW